MKVLLLLCLVLLGVAFYTIIKQEKEIVLMREYGGALAAGYEDCMRFYKDHILEL